METSTALIPGTPTRASDAFEAALDPKGGLTIGVSHDGATRATTLALEAARAAGGRTALITHRPAGPTASPERPAARLSYASHAVEARV